MRNRVLILVENLSVPFDRRVWAESQALVRAGFEVVVVCPQGRDRDQQRFEIVAGVEIHRYRPSESNGSAIGYAREYATAFWSTARLVLQLARVRPFDLVQACNPPDFLLVAALPLRRSGAAFVFDHHDLVPELYRERFARGGLAYRTSVVLERLAFALADVVISTNHSFRQRAIERGGRRPEDVFVVRNAPDPEKFRSVAADPSLKRGRVHLLAYVGMMGPQDGVDQALRALAILAQRRTDWHAIFVGDGDVLPRMRALATELGLSPHVEFTGFVADDATIVRILSTADVCLAPEPKNDLNDASTLIKVAEYMAVSKPVVSYDLLETRFTAGDAAAYARPNDPSSYADAIARLLDDPERRRQMGRAGRARVEGELSWERSERALLAAYEAALARAAERRPRRVRSRDDA